MYLFHCEKQVKEHALSDVKKTLGFPRQWVPCCLPAPRAWDGTRCPRESRLHTQEVVEHWRPFWANLCVSLKQRDLQIPLHNSFMFPCNLIRHFIEKGFGTQLDGAGKGVGASPAPWGCWGMPILAAFPPHFHQTAASLPYVSHRESFYCTVRD